MAFTYLKFSDSLIVDATLTPTTEAAEYPIENVQSEPVATTYRATSQSAQKILIDFAAPVTADLFTVVNHNLTSAADITLRGGSSQDPDGSGFELVIPWARRNAWEQFDAEEWRYWSVTIDDSTNPAVIEAGLLVIGEATELTRDFSFGAAKNRETVNQSLESEYGVITTGANIYQRTRFIASWKTTDASERTELDEFLLGLEKERGGMLFIPYPDEAEAFYGRFMTDYSLVRTGPDIAELSGLEFLEDSVGKSLF